MREREREREREKERERERKRERVRSGRLFERERVNTSLFMNISLFYRNLFMDIYIYLFLTHLWCVRAVRTRREVRGSVCRCVGGNVWTCECKCMLIQDICIKM